MWSLVRRHASLASALVVGVPGAAWTAVATYRASFAALGRDPGIFQYVAWALSRGQRDYVQIREINGPLVHLIHLAFLKLGGADEHVFRSLDLGLFALVAFATGASLPGLSERTGDGRREVAWVTRVAWGLAGWVVLSAGYMLFGWWEQGQRESFYNDLLLPGLALQLWAHRPSTPPRTRRWMFFLVGALGALTWFGKPTCVLYTAGQAAVVALDDEMGERARPNLVALALGCIASCLGMGVFLVVRGDPAAFVRIVFLETPRLYGYVWHKSFGACYVAWNNAPKLNYAFVTLAVGIVAVVTRRLSRRFLAILVLLLGGLVTFFIQGKGFPYHLHPIVAAVHLLWLASAAYFAERVESAQDNPSRLWHPALVGLGVVLLSYQSITETRLSPSMNNEWYADHGAGSDCEPFLRHFNGGDFFAWDLRRAGMYLRRVTSPDERVQTYGMDPYVLFLAQRLSATPYIYSFDVNVDAALEAGPGERDRSWLLAIARSHVATLGALLARDPPAAFVLIDRAPFTHAENAERDFADHCPEVAAWMRDTYREAERFGVVRVWLRNDVYARQAAAE